MKTSPLSIVVAGLLTLPPVAGTLFLSGCSKESASAPTAGNSADGGKSSATDESGVLAKFPGTTAGAKALLEALLQPGADVKGMSAALRPTKADYEAVFQPDLAAKVEKLHAPFWEKGELLISGKPGQTQVLLDAIPTTEIREWSKAVSDVLPGGYERIKDDFRDGLTLYRFKFVAPGETLGMAYDGLVFVNNHWRIFPKPWRAKESEPTK